MAPGPESHPSGHCRPDPSVPPFAPQGRALVAAWEQLSRGRRADVAPLEVHDADGPGEPVSPTTFFREPDAFEDWERALLDACTGRVLDVGAGAGAHALCLQRRGHAVTALDVDPDCVRVMTARGVVDARCGTLADMDDGPFDTLLFAMHGIGLAGDLPGLHWLLAECWRLLAPGGAVLLDSRAPDAALDAAAAADLAAPYPGETELWMRHGPLTGAAFGWLFVDAATLTAVAARVQLSATITRCPPEQPDVPGRYLARLRRDDAGSD